MATPRSRSFGLALLLVVAMLAATVSVLGAVAPDRAPAGRVASGGEVHFLPIVESSGYTSTAGAAVVAGIEGFGATLLDVKSWADAESQLDIRLRPAFEDDIRIGRKLAPGAAEQIALRHEPAVRRGRFAAAIASSGLYGAVAKTDWASGAAAAYEAPEIGTELILPLLVRNVYSHTSILYIQNTDDAGPDNEVDARIFDNTTGELQVSFTTMLEPGTAVSYDTWFDDLTFGDMPINAGEGGSIGALRVSADKPVAMIALGDEMAANATSAYVARPIGAASPLQYLPSVRANYLGYSEIALANPSMTSAVDATITYREHNAPSDDPGIVQALRVETRGATYVDLAGLKRGAPPPQDMALGTQPNGGFHGSAIIRASAPLLAVVQEEVRTGGQVRALAAYNAFGPDDLDTELAVPHLPNEPGGRRCLLVAMNPGKRAAEAVFAYQSTDGSPLASARIDIPAEGSREIVPEATLPQASALTITSDEPIAVLVYETTLRDAADWGHWGADTVVYSALRRGEPLGPTPVAPTATREPPTATATTAPATETSTATATTEATATAPAVSYPIFLPSAWRP